MITLLPTMQPRDVQQWIGGGICLMDRTIPVSYVTISRDKVVVRNVATREDTRIEMGDIGRLSIHWPRCGSLNIPGGAIYLMRRQQQQYRRTYNHRALSVIHPDKWSVLKTSPEVVQGYSDPMGMHIIAEAFNPTYPEWDRCMTMLATQQFVALNEHIILGGMPDLLSVYHRGRKCGTVINGVYAPMGKGLPISRAFKLLEGRITVC